MEVIIRMILRIFNAAFEEDVRSRREELLARRQPPPGPPGRRPLPHHQQQQRQQRRQQQQRQQPEQQSQRRLPPPPGPVDPPHANVEDPMVVWLKQVFGDESQSPQKPKPVTPKYPKKPPRPAPQTREQESLEEHLRHTKAQSQHLEKHLKDYLGVQDQVARKKQTRLEKLLGANPLKQLVLADVILGEPVSKRREQRGRRGDRADVL